MPNQQTTSAENETVAGLRQYIAELEDALLDLPGIPSDIRDEVYLCPICWERNHGGHAADCIVTIIQQRRAQNIQH